MSGPGSTLSPSRRGTATVVAAVALVALTVGLAVTVVVAVPTDAAPPEPQRAALSLIVAGDEIRLTHRAGHTLDVTELRIEVTVDGEALAHQPPVPFFAATGFEPGPTGPFNVAADQAWRAGEVATVEVAGTNDPAIDPGSTVRVRIWAGESLVGDLTATATRSER